MESKIIEVLSRKFSEKEVKERQGSFGKTLKYIEGHSVVSRLNEAFQHNWSFEILTSPDKAINNGFVVVQGRLTVTFMNGDFVTTLVKDSFGGKRLTKTKSTGEFLDIPADLKAASTDALKKAAVLLGVGLDLYSEDEDDDKVSDSADAKEDPNSPADQIQITAIGKMMKAKKIDESKLEAVTGVKTLANLTSTNAKKIITKLNEYKG